MDRTDSKFTFRNEIFPHFVWEKNITRSPNPNEVYNKELTNTSLKEFLEALLEIPKDFYTNNIAINFDPESRFVPLEEERIEGIVNSAKKQKMYDESIRRKILNLRLA